MACAVLDARARLLRRAVVVAWRTWSSYRGPTTTTSVTYDGGYSVPAASRDVLHSRAPRTPHALHPVLRLDLGCAAEQPETN
jgi:hypothetical protein